MPEKKSGSTFEKKKTSNASSKKKSGTQPTAKASTAGNHLAFESEIAVEILEELYPLILANCTDEDEEIDAQAVFEVLAGLIGFFSADYASSFGEKKALKALDDLQGLARAIFQARLAESNVE